MGCPAQRREIVHEPAGGVFTDISKISYSDDKLFLYRTLLYPQPLLFDSTHLSKEGNYFFDKGIPVIYEESSSCNDGLKKIGIDDFSILFPYSVSDTIIITFHDFTNVIDTNKYYIANADTIISTQHLSFDGDLKKWLIPEMAILNLIK